MPIQPTAEPFQWPISAYMSLAGTSAGAIVMGVVLSCSHMAALRSAARPAFLLGTVLMGIGFPFLILDLERPQDFFYILMYFNPKSVISWGARAIAVYFGLLILMTWLWHKQRMPVDWSLGWSRKLLAIAALVLAVIVGLYPGYVLNQGIARPLWDQPVIPYLFLSSSIHMGMAVIVLARLWEEHPQYPDDPIRRDHRYLRLLDGVLIGAQIALFGAYFYSCLQVAPDATWRLTSGTLGLLLWAGVALVGWVLPALDMIVRGAQSNLFARCLFILIGGACLRILVIQGGQGSAAFLGS